MTAQWPRAEHCRQIQGFASAAVIAMQTRTQALLQFVGVGVGQAFAVGVMQLEIGVTLFQRSDVSQERRDADAASNQDVLAGG